MSSELVLVAYLITIILGGFVLANCETYIITPSEGSKCQLDRNSTNTDSKPLNCYYDDQNILSSSNITMIFLNGTHYGNKAETILLQSTCELRLVGEGGANITSLNIVIATASECYELKVMFESVRLNRNSFSYSGGFGYAESVINDSLFVDSTIMLSMNLAVSNSTFQSTNISLFSGRLTFYGEVTMITFDSSLRLLNYADINFDDSAKVRFCRDLTCNKSGNLLWDARTSDMWIYISPAYNKYSDVKISKTCPFDYCQSSCTYYPDSYYYNNNYTMSCYKTLDDQCRKYRTGDLCGSCSDSLGIGLSGCLECSNNNNLALLIFFIAMGPLLVLVISVLNLTVTQGMINGIIFYANIVWTYKSFFIPTVDYEDTSYYYFFPAINPAYVVLAWLNLDFGLPACFYKGLTAPVKILFEFSFPFYMAGLFFIGLRYSSKLSKFLGSRSVPTLATLLFLSYTKLLRTVITCLQLATYTHYTGDKKIVVSVWAIDGQPYFGEREWHSYLFVISLAMLILLWIPYTFLLCFMQCLRKVDHYKPLKFIVKYKPFYDAHFGPLLDRHQYWFGLLLLIRGILLVLSSLTLHKAYEFNIFFLLFVVLSLLCYMTVARVYKRRVVLAFESLFLANLIFFISTLFYHRESATVIARIFPILGLLKIIVIVIMNLIISIHSCCMAKCKRLSPKDSHNEQDVELTTSARFRDSVLEDKVEPLLPREELD